MWLLKILGFRGLSMSELLPYLRGERHGKVVGITFDDGYANNLCNALPALQRHGFSSTCYVVSGLIGKANVWDEAKRVPQKPLMTAEELRRWIAGGQEVGGHTVTHANLMEVDEATAEAEIAGCKRDLEAICGVPCRHFCYPYGSYDARHAASAKRAGFESATTTVERAAEHGDSALELPRFGVLKGTTLFRFFRMVRS